MQSKSKSNGGAPGRRSGLQPFLSRKTAALAGAQPAEKMPSRLLSRLSMVLVTLSRISAAGKCFDHLSRKRRGWKPAESMRLN